ncbi:MAG: PKD domain-containing protein, partial [Verrucomicrobiota bacterium]
SLVKVANSEGYSSFAEIKVEVLDGVPLAAITAAPRSGSAPLTVQFQGNGTDYDGTIVAYAWDFTNDGVIDSTAQNPSFTYTQTGNYTARLTVTDNSNLTGSATVGIKVANPNSIAAVTIIASVTEGEAPLTVNFSADISGGGVVSAYAWDFNNDGVIDSTEAAPACVYNLSGLYTVKLMVTDVTGHSVTDYEYIIVEAAGLPAVDFTFSPARGIAPLEVNFQAVASDPDGVIVSYLWDFGDGTYSSQATPPPHTYALNQNYLVRLTVTDNDGNEVTVRKTVSVESGLGKLYGDGNEYEDIAVNQDGLIDGYYTYSVAPDVFAEECGRTGTAETPIYFRGQDGNTGGNTNGLANAHGDLTDGNFGYGKGKGVMWSGGIDPEITFDLQGKYALNNIAIWQDPIYDFESVTCYLSQDGIAWSQIGAFNSDGLNKVHLDLRNHSARKIKLAFNNTAGSPNAYLAEIQIWGTPFAESLMDWVDDFEYADSPLNHGWQVSCGIGTVSTVYDDFLKSNVMRVNSPDGWNFGIIRRPTDVPGQSYGNLQKRYLSYTIKSQESVWVYVLVHGDDNQWYYLTYRPSTNSNYVGGPFVYYSLPIVYEGNQNWNTISRDLETDLFTATGRHLKDVGLVFIRGGNYQLDDLSFSSSAPPTLNWGLFKDSVLSANGSMLKAMDYDLGREVIKVHSSDPCLFAIKSQKEAGTNKKYAHFNFKTTSDIGCYILVKGSPDGVSWSWYYICYLSGTGSSYTAVSYSTVYHYLGADVKSGKWVDVYRNLDSDLYVGFGVHLKEITWILTRGGHYCLNLAEFSDTPFKSDVGYWKLDEGGGTTAQDSSWRGNDGTLQGNPQWTSGRIEGALSFNGSNYVDCGNDDSLKVSAITMEAWVYSPTTNFAGPNEIAGAEGAYGFNITDNYIKIHINTVSQGWHWCASSAPLVWDGWHHVVFTYDGVNTVKCYRDGVLIFTDTTSSSGALQWAAWTTKLYIGQINTGSGERRLFKGMIDELKIYNHPLTAEEIRSDWQGT